MRPLSVPSKDRGPCDLMKACMKWLDHHRVLEVMEKQRRNGPKAQELVGLPCLSQSKGIERTDTRTGGQRAHNYS